MNFRLPLIVVSLSLVAIGCSGRPGVDVNANADVKLSRALPIDVGPTTQPLPITVGQPINVTIQGLTIDYEGTFIPEPLFTQVNEGDCQEFVAAVLGQPDFESQLGDGTVIWRWKYRPKGQAVSIVNVFGGKSDEPRPDHVSAIVQFRDGKLMKKWRG